MSEELLELTEAEVLVDGDVVVSLEREPGQNEEAAGAGEPTSNVVEVKFGGRDLADHIGDSDFGDVPPSNVRIYAPSHARGTESKAQTPITLHSDARTANRTEAEFTGQGAIAA